MERRVFGPAVFANLNSTKKEAPTGGQAVKLQREGLFRELKRRKAYEKLPTEERGRKARQFAGEERPRGSSLNAKV